MDISTQLKNIATKAVTDNAKKGLRGGSIKDQHERMADCHYQIAQIMRNQLTPEELANYAAGAMYMEAFYEHSLEVYENSIDEFLTAISEVPTRGRRKPKIIEDALRKLRKLGHPLISILVEESQNTVPILKASASGKKGKSKSNAVREFAIKLYMAKRWPNTSQARYALWPQIQKEAVRLGCPMTDTEGPTTVYKWFLAYNKAYGAN